MVYFLHMDQVLDAKKKEADPNLRSHIEEAYSKGLNPLPFLRRKYDGLWIYNPSELEVKQCKAIYSGVTCGKQWVIA